MPGANRRLPGSIASAFGELVEDAAGLGQRPLVALADQEDIHVAMPAVSTATDFNESIMKSSASLRVSASMQERRNSCSSSPRIADRNACGRRLGP
jgi:hypothetical protein